MRIVFLGTPDFAVASLVALVDAGHEVCAAFSQPDRPVGRHQGKLRPTPVKEYALSRGIPVFQPEKLRDGTALARLKELDPELLVTAAYGRILPDDILSLPPKGCINVHGSLLPKYRGAAPIQWAILNGERETGITIMHMAHDMDAGDIIAQSATPIGPDETAGELFDRLALLGGKLLAETVERLAAGAAKRTPQDPSQATLAPMISKKMSPVDWTRSAQAVYNQLRGLNPWPGASTDVISGDPVKLWGAQVVETRTGARPGAVVKADGQGIDIACGDGKLLRVLELQPPGGRRMSAGDYLRGRPISRRE